MLESHHMKALKFDDDEPTSLRYRFWLWRYEWWEWFTSIPIVHKIQRAYWRALPYDWRPGQIYYRLKCFLWHRYSTVKPRTLGHTWVDRCRLIEELNFECLAQFVEGEIENNDYSEEGYSEIHSEMLYLYHWWLEYPKWNEKVQNEIWEEMRKHKPIETDKEIDDPRWGKVYEWIETYNTPEDEEIYKRGFQLLHALDSDREKQIDENLHRLINIHRHLWS